MPATLKGQIISSITSQTRLFKEILAYFPTKSLATSQAALHMSRSLYKSTPFSAKRTQSAQPHPLTCVFAPKSLVAPHPTAQNLPKPLKTRPKRAKSCAFLYKTGQIPKTPEFAATPYATTTYAPNTPFPPLTPAGERTQSNPILTQSPNRPKTPLTPYTTTPYAKRSPFPPKPNEPQPPNPPTTPLTPYPTTLYTPYTPRTRKKTNPNEPNSPIIVSTEVRLPLDPGLLPFAVPAIINMVIRSSVTRVDRSLRILYGIYVIPVLGMKTPPRPIKIQKPNAKMLLAKALVPYII